LQDAFSEGALPGTDLRTTRIGNTPLNTVQVLARSATHIHRYTDRDDLPASTSELTCRVPQTYESTQDKVAW